MLCFSPLTPLKTDEGKVQVHKTLAIILPNVNYFGLTKDARALAKMFGDTSNDIKVIYESRQSLPIDRQTLVIYTTEEIKNILGDNLEKWSWFDKTFENFIGEAKDGLNNPDDYSKMYVELARLIEKTYSLTPE